MARPTFLQIQTRALPPRITPLEGLAVRIGRGPQCEVRLDEPGLAEVQCLLRRRGESWHIQPVGPSGMLFLDGRPIESQRLWPAGVPMRIGAHWLSLRRSETPAEEVGSFEAPILVEPATTKGEGGRPDVFVGHAYQSPTTAASPGGLAAEQERLQRWEAQLRQRERWLEARREERRWEARWRAAGEALRARSAGDRRPPGPTVAEPPADPRTQEARCKAHPAGEGRPDVRETSPPTDPPSGANGVGDEAEPWPGVPTAPEMSATVEAASPVDPEVDDFRASWDSEHLIGVETIDEAEDGGTPSPSVGADPSISVPPVTGDSAGEVGPARGGRTTPTDEPSAAPERMPRSPRGRPMPVRLGTVFRSEPGHSQEDRQPIGRIGEARSTTTPPNACPELEPQLDELPGSGGAPADEPSREGVARDPRVPSPASETGEAPADDFASWPSVHRILGEGSCHRHASPRRKEAARAAVRPQPTLGRPPQRWSLPIRLIWLSATLAALGLGVLGIGLGWLWGQDDRVAGLIADRVLGKAELPEAPVTDLSRAPSPSWWGSTAGHLYLRALSESRSPGDPEAEEKVRFLLDAARVASPLEPQARFALATAVRTGDDQRAGSRPIGMSRDVVALAATGKALQAAGRVEAALKAYRSALAMASEVEADRTAPAPFDEDREVLRFSMPGEDLMAPVIEGMARLDWPFAEWSEALPRSAKAAIACYRVLHRMGSPDADRAIDLIPEEGNSSTPPVELAARAEAHAFRERWDEAEALYRRAIAGMAIDPIRRSWWFNLGSIAGRAGDATRANEAWENAKSPRPGDEIHRRVAEAQIRAGIGVRPTSGPGEAPGARP